MTVLFFLLGFLFLLAGAEMLVRGASRLAALLGISPLIVGLTIVAFGTSAPELAVSLKASLIGKPNLSFGNVAGSNLANVLLILGLSALAAPIVVTAQLVRRDLPIMIGASLLTWLMAADGAISRGEGLLLFAGMAGYLASTYFLKKPAPSTVPNDASSTETARFNVLFSMVLALGGLFILVLGARWLVDSSVATAQYLGIDERIIGLTVVAIGTSLPELATSLIAALRGERDIAVGNAVGSNIFNILAVLGLSASFAHGGLPIAPDALTLDLPLMVLAAVLCAPVFFTGAVISRWEGALFLTCYVLYLVYLILNVTAPEAAMLLRAVVWWCFAPLAALALLLSLVHSHRKRTG